MSLRILQVCPKPPFPPVDGGCIAANNITEGLLGLGHRVKVMALSTPKHPADTALENAEYVRRTGFETSYLDTSIKLRSALRHFFSSRSYNVERFYSKQFDAKILACLSVEEFDVIQLESIYMTPYLPSIRGAVDTPIIYRSHNMEFEIWQGTCGLERNPLRRLYIAHLAKRLGDYERSTANWFDGIATITEADKKTLRSMGCSVPIRTIPFGLNISQFTSEVQPRKTTVFHLGSMDWLPNQDGIRWFLNEVWPVVLSRHSDVQLILAGRSMPGWLNENDCPNVRVVGEVDSAFDFIAANSIMIVPLHSGGGMRIKIIEGLALGKAIVSTTLGAAGIDYVDGRDILIADSADLFADSVCKLLDDPKFCARLSENGLKLARERYDNKVICANLVDFYESVLDS